MCCVSIFYCALNCNAFKLLWIGHKIACNFLRRLHLANFFFLIEALLELTHFKIYTRARGREQFTVTRDFIPFTLEVLQFKYLLFFNILENFKGWNKFATNWFWLVGLEYLLVKYCLVGLLSMFFPDLFLQRLFEWCCCWCCWTLATSFVGRCRFWC